MSDRFSNEVPWVGWSGGTVVGTGRRKPELRELCESCESCESSLDCMLFAPSQFHFLRLHTCFA